MAESREMTDKEAYKIIGERAEEIAKLPEVQQKMVEIAHRQGKDAAEKYLYIATIGTLTGK